MREVGTGHLNTRMAAAQTPEENATSVITFAEIPAIFARRFRKSPASQGEFDRIRMIFELDWADNITKLDVSPAILGFIRKLAERSPLRGADTIHLASALSLTARSGSSISAIKKLVFAASDRQLKTAALILGLEVFDPEEN